MSPDHWFPIVGGLILGYWIVRIIFKAIRLKRDGEWGGK